MKFHEERIGDCKLFLGDCREILQEFDSIDSLVTDPPYGMNFRSNHRKEKYEAIENDDQEWPIQFCIDLKVNHSKYIFGRWDNLQNIPKPKSVITWVKNNWSMGDLNHEHARQTETIFFYEGGGTFLPQ